MRRFGLVLVGLLVTAFAWQVAGAADPPTTVTICTRAGSDVRTPAPNGSCPSGYQKQDIALGSAIPEQKVGYTSSARSATVVWNLVPTSAFEAVLPLSGSVDEAPQNILGQGTDAHLGQTVPAPTTLTRLEAVVRPMQPAPSDVTLHVQLYLQNLNGPPFATELLCSFQIASGSSSRQHCSDTTLELPVVPGQLLYYRVFADKPFEDGSIDVQLAVAVV